MRFFSLAEGLNLYILFKWNAHSLHYIIRYPSYNSNIRGGTQKFPELLKKFI